MNNKQLHRIPPHLAQEILDNLVKFLKKDTQIIDGEGRIIASIRPEEKEDYSPEAIPLIQGKIKELYITPEDKRQIHGVKASYSLPLFFEGEIIGAISIL